MSAGAVAASIGRSVRNFVSLWPVDRRDCIGTREQEMGLGA